MTFSHNITKNGKKILTVAFIAQKAIFANFGQLWMVVYTAIIKNFIFFQLYRMHIGVTKKVIQKKLMGGGEFLPPQTWNRVKQDRATTNAIAIVVRAITIG